MSKQCTSCCVIRSAWIGGGVGASAALILSGLFNAIRMRQLLSRLILIRAGVWAIGAFYGGSAAFSLYTVLVHQYPQFDYVISSGGELIKRKTVSINGGLALSLSGTITVPLSKWFLADMELVGMNSIRKNLKYFPVAIVFLFGTGSVVFPQVYNRLFLRYHFSDICSIQSKILLGWELNKFVKKTSQ
jgi:hypothetical protein